MSTPPALTVFVSSTWLDLGPERAAVSELMLRLRGLRFVGMEHFGARDDDTRSVSLQEATGADLFVLIIGSRWGSGITEAEYRRCRELAKPAFVYLLAGSAPSASTESEAQRARLDAFRHELRGAHLCVEFTSAADLAARLSADLHNWLFERLLARGLERLSVDYLARIHGFVWEYLGSADHPVPFGGRDAELALLDAWLAEAKAEPYLLVAAGAGRGKSALLVRWTQSLLGRDDVVPLFFPVSIRFRTNLSGVLFASLNSYLGTLHGEHLAVSPDTPPEVLRGRVADLLSRPLPGGRRLVLVLDGLDEAADWEAGPDLFPPQVGRHARVVVSARLRAGDADERDWLRRLGWDAPGAARALALAGIDAGGVASVLAHMGFPLAALADRGDLVQELYRLSAGDPLLVRLYVDDMGRRDPAAAAFGVAELRRIEPGLEGFFARWWDDQRRLWGRDTPLRQRPVQVLLDLLAGALGALTRDDLLELAPAEVELTRWTLQEALEPLQRFIVGDGVTQGYVFSHPRLAQHFWDGMTRSEQLRLDERFVAWCERSVAALAGATPATAAAPGPLGAQPDLSPYVLQFFGAHLDRLQAPSDRYEPFLAGAWREAWRRSEGTYSGYRGDLLRMWRAVERQHRGAGVPAPGAIARLAHLALCLSSLEEVARSTPPELVAPLVQAGLWGRKGAVAYARAIADPMQRARALIRLAPLEEPHTRSVVLAEALECLEGYLDGEAAWYLAFQVAPHEAAGPLLVEELSAAAPALPRALRSRALAIALRIADERLQCDAAMALLPHLGAEALDAVSSHAARCPSSGGWRYWRTALVARHPALMFERLQALGLDGNDAWLLLELAPHLQQPQRGLALAQARSAIDAALGEAVEPADIELLLAWARLAQPAAPEPLLMGLPQRALSWPASPTRARLLAEWARLCPASERAGVVAVWHGTIDALLPTAQYAQALRSAGTDLQLPEARRWLVRALADEDESRRNEALVCLVRQLEGADRAHALQAIQETPDIGERFDALLPMLDLCTTAQCEALAHALIEDPAAQVDWLMPRIEALAGRLTADAAVRLMDSAAAARFSGPDGPCVALYGVLARRLPIAGVRSVHLAVCEDLAGGFTDHRRVAAWAADCPKDLLESLVHRIHDRRRLITLAAQLPQQALQAALGVLQRIHDVGPTQQLLGRALAAMPLAHIHERLGQAWRMLSAEQRGRQVIEEHSGPALDAVALDSVVQHLMAMHDQAFLDGLVAWHRRGGLRQLHAAGLHLLLQRVDGVPGTQIRPALEAVEAVADDTFVHAHAERLFRCGLRCDPGWTLVRRLSARVGADRFLAVFGAACEDLDPDSRALTDGGDPGHDLLQAATSLPPDLAEAAHGQLDRVLRSWPAASIAAWIAGVIKHGRDADGSLFRRERRRLEWLTEPVPWLRAAWALTTRADAEDHAALLAQVREQLLRRGDDDAQIVATLPSPDARHLAELGAREAALLHDMVEHPGFRPHTAFQPALVAELRRLPLGASSPLGWGWGVARVEQALLRVLSVAPPEVQVETAVRLFDGNWHHEFAAAPPQQLAALLPYLPADRLRLVHTLLCRLLTQPTPSSVLGMPLLVALLQRADAQQADELWRALSLATLEGRRHPDALLNWPLALFIRAPAALPELLGFDPSLAWRLLAGYDIQQGDAESVLAHWAGWLDRHAVAIVLGHVAAALRPAAEQERWLALVHEHRRALDGSPDVWTGEQWATQLNEIDWFAGRDEPTPLRRADGAQAEEPSAEEPPATDPDPWRLASHPTRAQVLHDLEALLPGGDSPEAARAVERIVRAVVDTTATWP